MTNRSESRFGAIPALPPLDAAPILQHQNRYSRQVDRDHQLEARVDERGIVDVYATVQDALSLVDDQYVWPREGLVPADIHHFVWERQKYKPEEWQGSQIPREYREIPYHKGYLPRQLHNFMHAAIAPPPVPDFEVMRQRVEAYNLAKQLFLSARQAIVFSRRPERAPGISRHSDGRLSIEDEVLEMILKNMQTKFSEHKFNVLAGNEFIGLSTVELSESTPERLATQLGRVAAHNGINFMPFIYGNRVAA